MNYKIQLTITVFGMCLMLNACREKAENEIKITRRDALEIAKRYEISGDSIVIFFKTYIYPKTSLAYQNGKRKLLYWDVSKECNHCSHIQIDALTGKVFFEGKYEYIY